MARPYADPVEIITAPIPAQSPFIPDRREDRGGAVAPASPDPIPIVLLPGFEYRMREWRHPSTHEIHWRLERRKSTQHGEDDWQPARVKQLVTGCRSFGWPALQGQGTTWLSRPVEMGGWGTNAALCAESRDLVRSGRGTTSALGPVSEVASISRCHARVRALTVDHGIAGDEPPSIPFRRSLPFSGGAGPPS